MLRTLAAALLTVLLGCGGTTGTTDAGGLDGASDAASDGATDGSADATPDAGGPDASTALGPNAACDANGCLRTASFVGDFPKASLTPFLEFGVDIDHGYSVWTIEFVTDGRTSLGTVTVPLGVEAPARGWAVVANAHGTSGVGDACKLAGTVAGAGLAGLLGARKMVGVAPDYPGLGTSGVHPYLVAESEGRAVLDSLRAAAQLARWQRARVSGRYGVVGLSQGGHAVLAAASAHRSYAPELDIRAFGASAPASGWQEQWRAGVVVDGTHQAFHALLVYAWSEHNGWELSRGPLFADGLADELDDIMATTCIVPTASSGLTLGTRLGSVASEIFAPAFLRAYGSGEWGVYADFATWFDANRIVPYEQTAPLRIYQGDADTTVLEAGTRQLVEALRAGGVEVEYEVVPGGEHTNVAFGFVAFDELRTEESMAWLRGLVDAE